MSVTDDQVMFLKKIERTVFLPQSNCVRSAGNQIEDRPVESGSQISMAPRHYQAAGEVLTTLCFKAINRAVFRRKAAIVLARTPQQVTTGPQ